MELNRRTLLVGGGAGAGLLLAWGLWPRTYRPNLVTAPGEVIFNAFLKIGEDGHVAVVVPQAEMGQGVWTSLPQVLADELGADWRTISVEPAPISPLYANDFMVAEAAEGMLPDMLKGIGGWAARQFAIRSALMVTGGSSSIRGFEQRFREAGAIARALLCSAAGERWGADWRACETAGGFVTRGDEKLRFGELAAEAAKLEPPPGITVRLVGAGGLSGRSVPRIDLPSKVDGTARFAGDVRVQDLVYAAVRHGPHGASRLAGADKAAADKVHGVLAVVENPGWVAAVATNSWAAERALDAMRPRFAVTGGTPDSASIAKALETALNGTDATRFVAIGDLDAAFAGRKGLKVDYSVPVAVHAAMEPLTATARLAGDRLEIWMPTQAPGLSRSVIAKAMDMAESQVTIYPMLVGGGFGRKIENDAAVQAAIIAREVKRPVQLTWSRREDIAQDRFRPPARARMAAALGDRGEVLGWQARIATPPAMAQMGARLMPGSGGGDAKAELSAIEGALPPYAIPAIAVDHLPADIGIPTGIWRSVAHSYTGFFNECFVDELARIAGIEPLSFRMQMMGGNTRLAHCLTTVTALGGWDGGVAGGNMGLAAHSSFGSHVAMLVEAHVGDAQQIIVDRVFAAVDCGRVVHPDIVVQQIEGGIIWGIAAALGATTGFTRGMADAHNFDALNLPTLATTPDIRVELVPSREAPGGVGEIAVPPVAPAIANALFAATGRRLRSLPLMVGGQ
ncbi:xanthine dehydrogenase family protein molybdopterin-binding subunit [Sphingomonas sp. KC8]|uniref:xanthine dehydrogenase family protein molybdopterin-binding subunit n=1 Tax=Sphingomonas sp. KC8 TaxID=1030157 RepID=UPI000248A3FB|nr:molybdopterin cofactor-binding domain-containing protein [Sphingomonas sp. KC8]ARS27347.1 isoquinoline 1-oxidoreductase [Sphingomonas sp. KC8]